MLNFLYRCFEKKTCPFLKSLLNLYYKRTSFLNTITCILIYRVLKYQNFLEFHFLKHLFNFEKRKQFSTGGRSRQLS